MTKAGYLDSRLSWYTVAISAAKSYYLIHIKKVKFHPRNEGRVVFFKTFVEKCVMEYKHFFWFVFPCQLGGDKNFTA